MERGTFAKRKALIQETLSALGNVNVVPMSRYSYFDPILDGNYRFGYCVGNAVASLVSRTTFDLKEALVPGTTTLQTSSVVMGDLTGCVLIVNNTESMLVKSSEIYLESSPYVEYQLEDAATFNHIQGSPVAIEAFEVYRLYGADFAEGTSVIQLQSNKPLVSGDLLAKLVNNELNVVLSSYVRLQTVKLDSQSGSLYNYTVVLSSPLPFALDVNSRCFVKASPAYTSNKLMLDTQRSHLRFDTFNGKTFGTGTPEITFGIEMYDVTGRHIRSTRCGVNDSISISGLKTHELALFQVHRGSIRVENTLTLMLDEEGLFNCGDTFPEIDISLGLSLESNGAFEATLIADSDTENFAGASKYYLSNSKRSSSLELRIKGHAGQKIIVENVIPLTDRVHSISYSIHADIAPGESFETTGLILKPAFRSSLDCFESNAILELNSGYTLQ